MGRPTVATDAADIDRNLPPPGAFDPSGAPLASTTGAGAPPSLADFGVIGNLHTAALVSKRGSIDWACLPRFASPSVFARLLDPSVGGFHELAPVEPVTSVQEYLPSTNVLRTCFRWADGRTAELLDFMPIAIASGPVGLPMIVRVVRAYGGPVRLRLLCQPRFDYGERAGRWRRIRGGHQARADDSELMVMHPWKGEMAAGRLTAIGEVEPRSPLALEIIWGSARPTDATAGELLRETTSFWRRWSHAGRRPLSGMRTRWQGAVLRSELVLKLLSQEDTGAFLAAPTTSLPEWPGGRRNWDYRYAWIRDAAFSAEALLMLDHKVEAEAFLRWTVGRLRAQPGGERLRVMYGADGEADLTERTLPHLAGYANSRPVRVGNAAAGQFQLDIYGELLDVASVLSEIDGPFVRGVWTELALLVDSVARNWRRPDHGIWEIRTAPCQYTHSKTMAWVALDRAVTIARRLGLDDERVVGWAELADRIRTTILTRGYNDECGSFTQTLDGTSVDAAELRLPMVGLLPFTDARVRGTVRRIREELSSGPFVFRYRTEDGIPGAEGAFLPCSFWLVECLARSGAPGEAARLFDALLPVGGPLSLFSEAADPRSGRPLGNYPQALTHIALLRAAWALSGRKGMPERKAEEGPADVRAAIPGSRAAAPRTADRPRTRRRARESGVVQAPQRAGRRRPTAPRRP